MRGWSLEEYRKLWDSFDNDEDKKMIDYFLKKSRDKNREIEVKWGGDNYISFYPDGSLNKHEHEGQEDEFQKYEEVVTIGITKNGKIF